MFGRGYIAFVNAEGWKNLSVAKSPDGLRILFNGEFVGIPPFGTILVIHWSPRYRHAVASGGTMVVTAYFLSHGHWTAIPHQLGGNFRDMVDCGFTAVAISFSESDIKYSRRAFEIQVDLPHCCGLQVFVVPSRLGRRLEGSMLGRILAATARWAERNGMRDKMAARRARMV